MGRECPVSGKKTSFGNHKTERGKAKYLGGVGKKTTGVSRRTFKPNLQRIHIWLPNGTTRYIRVATSVIRSGSDDPRGRRQGSDLSRSSRRPREARRAREAQESLSDLSLPAPGNRSASSRPAASSHGRDWHDGDSRCLLSSGNSWVARSRISM